MAGIVEISIVDDDGLSIGPFIIDLLDWPIASEDPEIIVLTPVDYIKNANQWLDYVVQVWNNDNLSTSRLIDAMQCDLFCNEFKIARQAIKFFEFHNFEMPGWLYG